MFLLGLVQVAFIAAPTVQLESVVLMVARSWFSDRIALYALHGRLFSREEQPELHGACSPGDPQYWRWPRPRSAAASPAFPPGI